MSRHRAGGRELSCDCSRAFERLYAFVLVVVRVLLKKAGLRAMAVLLPLLAFSSAATAASLPPTIESVSVSGITERDATLEVRIDTQGSYTGYWFQVDTSSSYDFTQADCPFDLPGYAECESITVGEPLPAGFVEPRPEYIQAGSGDQTVSLDLASIGTTLQSATTYHYRVLATNGGGSTVFTPDQTFETLGAPWSPPVPIEPLPVNQQIEKEFEEHPPWDRVPQSPPAEVAPSAPAASVTSSPACIVPSLKGDPLDRARRALGRAHCALGKVVRPRDGRGSALVVIGQNAQRGTTLPDGAHVGVALARRRAGR
jgi:hypothetical protein